MSVLLLAWGVAVGLAGREWGPRLVLSVRDLEDFVPAEDERGLIRFANGLAWTCLIVGACGGFSAWTTDDLVPDWTVSVLISAALIAVVATKALSPFDAVFFMANIWSLGPDHPPSGESGPRPAQPDTNALAGRWLGVRVDQRPLSRRERLKARWKAYASALVDDIAGGSWSPCDVVIYRWSDGRTLCSFAYNWAREASDHADNIRTRLTSLDVETFCSEFDLDPDEVRLW